MIFRGDVGVIQARAARWRNHDPEGAFIGKDPDIRTKHVGEFTVIASAGTACFKGRRSDGVVQVLDRHQKAWYVHARHFMRLRNKREEELPQPQLLEWRWWGETTWALQNPKTLYHSNYYAIIGVSPSFYVTFGHGPNGYFEKKVLVSDPRATVLEIIGGVEVRLREVNREAAGDNKFPYRVETPLLRHLGLIYDAGYQSWVANP